MSVEFLVGAARTRFDPDAGTSLSGLAQKHQDWDRLLEAARSHGMLPLLYHQLAQFCPNSIPSGVLERLRDGFEKNSRRTLLLSAELARILNLFDTHGIRAIPFKGPVLAATLYGDPARRRSDDLDLLISSDQVWRAVELLESRGFNRQASITRDQLEAYFQSECDLDLVQSNSGLWIELHWAMTPPYYGFPLDTGRFWDRLTTEDLLGTTVPALPTEDLMVVLCLHGSKHMWDRLEWICGVAELVKKNPTADWESVLSCSKTMRGERIVLLGFSLAHEWMGIALPPCIQAEIQKTPAIAALSDDVRRGLFSGRAANLLRLTTFRLKLLRSTKDRIRYCRIRALTPSYRDLGWVRLPRSLSFFYYLFRPVRLGWHAVRERLGARAAPMNRNAQK